jgi:hypothetical protein
MPAKMLGLICSGKHELVFQTYQSRTIQMPNNSDCNIATADALTLLLHNQHALGAAIEEITHWIAGDGADIVADNAVAALGALDANAKAITDAIMRLRLC